MHVVQIAPPWFPVPPVGYGGIERVVYDLCEGLVAAGHEVTLFAPGDSSTSARLVPTVPRGVGLDLPPEERTRLMADASSDAFEAAAELDADIIHDHTDFIPDPGFPIPVVRTIHGPAVDYFVRLYRRLTRLGDRFVAISRRQRDLFEEAAAETFGPGQRIAFVGVVANPVDVAAAPFYPASAKEGYVAFLGRSHWEKSPDGAIRVAKAAGVPLKMALRVTAEERPYFNAVVKPLIDRYAPAEFLGEVSGAAKDELIGRAAALLFPSPWEEPFGIVLTEAAARGTPVVSLARGSAPEIVVHGVTGVLCVDEEEMARLVPRAMALDPAACRAHAEANYDRDLIARQYVAVYEQVTAEGRRVSV